MNESAEYKALEADSYSLEDGAEAVLPNPDMLSAANNLAELNTEELLHKVVEAAEHNQALEKLLELRHEVKDKPDHPVYNDTTASQVGELLPMHPAYGLSLSHTGQKSRLSKLVHDKSMYGYAIRYGFISALVCLILAIILVSVFTR